MCGFLQVRHFDLRESPTTGRRLLVCRQRPASAVTAKVLSQLWHYLVAAVSVWPCVSQSWLGLFRACSP